MGRVLAAVDEAKIDAIFATMNQCALPGAAIGIAVDGKPVYRKGFGLANMDLPVVLTPSTRMRIASLTKHFTCLAYLLACEGTDATLDDPVGKYLPELHQNTHRITVRQLMAHTHGLRDVSDICWHLSGLEHSGSTADLLGLYRTIDDINEPPQANWHYTSGAYVILTAIIEKLTGRPLEDVLRQRIFEPVGMTSTLLLRREKQCVSNSASAHIQDAAENYQTGYIGGDLAGEGGLVSTVDDMLRWLAHMDAPVVGDEAIWKAMTTPGSLSNGVSTNYGLGLSITRFRGLTTIHHHGGLVGLTSLMVKAPEAGLDLIVIVNRDDFDAPELGDVVLDACLPGLERPHSASRPISRGVFHSSRTGRVVELTDHRGRQVFSLNAKRHTFEGDGDGALRPVSSLRYLKWEVTPIGDWENPASIAFDSFGNVDELTRIETSGKDEFDEIVGRYRCASADVDALIGSAANNRYLKTIGSFGMTRFPLQSLGDRVWQAKDSRLSYWGGVLVFDEDLQSFLFSTERNQSMRFERLR